MSKEAGNVIENVTSIKIPDKLKDGKKEIDMCLALREIIEEEKADIIKDSERKINDAVTHKIIDLFVKGKLDLEEAAHECNLTVEDFIHAKEDYEGSALA